MVGGSLLMVNTQVVDQAMAAMLPAGSVAALSYGNKIMAVPLNVAVTALGTALVPYLSSSWSRSSDWSALGHTVGKVPAPELWCGPASDDSAGLSGRCLSCGSSSSAGRSAPEDTRVVAGVQALACLQIPFYLAGILVVRTISSLSANQILIWGNLLNLTVNVVFNFLFMRWWGVAGIALSTSVMYSCRSPSCTISYSRALRKLRRAGRRSLMRCTLVIDGLGPGGAQRDLSTMANHWAARGWPVSLIDPRRRPPKGVRRWIRTSLIRPRHDPSPGRGVLGRLFGKTPARLPRSARPIRDSRGRTWSSRSSIASTS